MKAINLMEEFVRRQVDDMYARLKNENVNFPICDCENCRMDTVCYVLNRVPTKYTVSGRGVNHAQMELETLKQLSADVDTIIMEGIRLISTSKRPNHNFSYLSKTKILKAETPYFFFPVFSGAVFDGTTFEPLSNAFITLLVDKENAQMIDSTWQNPSKTCKATEGSYIFCVKPEKAKKENETGTFAFELKIDAEGYDSIIYAFTVPVSSKIIKDESESFSNYSLKIQDLFLFPTGAEYPMERYVKPLEEK